MAMSDPSQKLPLMLRQPRTQKHCDCPACGSGPTPEAGEQHQVRVSAAAGWCCSCEMRRRPRQQTHRKRPLHCRMPEYTEMNRGYSRLVCAWLSALLPDKPNHNLGAKCLRSGQPGQKR
jgi:hypothetical protein